MTFAQRPLHAAPIVATLVLALAGCSSLEPDKIDYRSSGRGVPLEVPPDLTQLPGQSRYSVPATVTASGYQAGQAATAGATKTTVPNTIADVHYMRNGDERWLQVDRPPEKVWPLVRDFWLDNGFLIAVDNPTTGILETDWAENRAKIPQDIIRNTLGKVFDSLYSTGERDKFRVRVERDAKGGTDIYITHRGMEEVYNSARRDSTVWQPRARDPGLEDEFLRRLMVALGVTQEQSKAALASASAAAAAAGPQARVVSQDGAPAIALSDDFDRAWRRVGLTLDRTGFTVEDRDRAKGIYYVRYVDPTIEKKEPGFFSKLFGGASTQLPAAQYQIGVHAQGGGSLVTVQGNQGAAVPERDAQRIIKVLADDLK